MAKNWTLNHLIFPKDWIVIKEDSIILRPWPATWIAKTFLARLRKSHKKQSAEINGLEELLQASTIRSWPTSALTLLNLTISVLKKESIYDIVFKIKIFCRILN